eukprot:scaffold123298_cov21-Tisochrysis_lutea.AAC.1
METCTVYTPGKWKDLKPLTPDAECMGAIETKDASKFSSLAMDALAGTCIQCCASSSSAGTMQKESHTYSNLLQWISWPGVTTVCLGVCLSLTAHAASCIQSCPSSPPFPMD